MKGEYVDKGTGCSRLNAKLLVDAAIMAVVYNSGAMVQDPKLIMSLPSMKYKKMAIMLHAAEDMAVVQAQHIGLDSHMYRVIGDALGHIDTTGDYRAEQLESYLPKELWGRINDKLCSICQLLRRRDQAPIANGILEKIRDDHPEFRGTFEEYRQKILTAYDRECLI